MISRFVSALRLDPRLFTRIAQAEVSIDEAALVSVLIAVLAGAGAAANTQLPLLAFLLEFVNSLVVGWILWAAITRQIARRLGCRLESVDMTRLLAYASVPRLLLFFGFIPFFGWFFRVPGWTLSLILGAIAMRELTGRDDPRLLLSALPGLTLYIILSAIICLYFGGMPMAGL